MRSNDASRRTVRKASVAGLQRDRRGRASADRRAAAHGWPTATALVFKYETTGPVAHVWGLWRVLNAERQTLREWEDDLGGMSDESDKELVALDLISNPRETLDYTDFGTPIGSTVLILHTLTL